VPLEILYDERLPECAFIVEREGDITRLTFRPMHLCDDTMELARRVSQILTYEEREELRAMYGMPNMKVATLEQAHEHWVNEGRPLQHEREPVRD
jgi:hypothetical protein